MGDRWSYPHQTSSATYVWQPLSIAGLSISIPVYRESWQVSTINGTWAPSVTGWKTIDHSDKETIRYYGQWQHSLPSDSVTAGSTDAINAYFSVSFSGRQIGLYCIARPDGGYARITLHNSKGRTVLSSVIDTYCKYPASLLKLLTPVLAKDNYTLTVTVMGEHGNWRNKRGTVFGSTGNFVSLDKIVISE